MKVKLSDFGFHKEVDYSRVSMSTCGTMKFAAPEVAGYVEGRVLPFITDIYSLALTAYWMLTKTTPVIFRIKKKP